MNSVEHSTTNRVFGAPAGWNQEGVPCDPLPVTIGSFGGLPAIRSYWRPSPEELAVLMSGGLIELATIGPGMPPVAVNVTHPDA